MPQPQSQSKKISLKLQSFVLPAPMPKPLPVSKPVPPEPTLPPKPVEQSVKKPAEQKPKQPPVEKKNTIQKTTPVAAVKSEENNVTKPVRKVVKKEKPKEAKKQPPKRVVRYPQPRTSTPKRSSDPLANALMGSGSAMTQKPSTQSFADQMVKRIYGKEFYSFTPQQQKFIKDKLGEIHRITQNTLWQKGYPNDALRLQLQGTNIVSFYLHPNGDISQLRLVTAIGYRSLDENTIEVIKTAYKDYPRPQEKTKIMFYVMYQLY